jgi:ATP phosphoribosyltransferase regulatory subunit
MMGLRSDITAQIARIAVSRLVDEPRPLRLTYANDVIRTRGSQARTQRQFTQVGCEMIGPEGAQADVEICVVALKGLAALGLKNVTIDFALPQRAGEIFKITNTPESEIDVLRHTLAGGADKALAALEEIGLSDLEGLKAVVSGVKAAVDQLGLDVRVTIDPLESRGFEYHKGLGFTLFSSDIRGEVGRGGRYMLGDSAESAAGFTLYMDTLRQGLKPMDAPKVKTVSTDAPWDEIQKHQDNGFIVKRG